MNNLFFIETQNPRLGRWFIECDRDSNSRADVIRRIATGDVHPIKILEVCEDENWVRDVTSEIFSEVAEKFCASDRSNAADRQAQVWDHARKHRDGRV